MIEEILSKSGLKIEDLNAAERQTLFDKVQSMATKVLTVEDIKETITQMKDSVEAELAGYSEPKTVWDFLFSKRKDIYRRARLRNNMLLLAYLSGPEKAKKAIEQSLQNIKTKH
jgi:hypothetical protein